MPLGEDSGLIELDRDVIRYTSETDSDFAIRVHDIRVVGEATNQSGPFTDDYFLCFVTDPEGWYEASFYTDGLDTFLTALGARLGVPLELRLSGSTDFASRILWPIELVGKPMFKYRGVPPKTVVGRLLGCLLGPMQIQQTYSDQVTAELGGMAGVDCN